MLLVLISTNAMTQRHKTDSLLRLLPNKKSDTSQADLLYELTWEFLYSNPDSAILFAKQGVSIMKRLSKNELKKPKVIRHLSNMYNGLGAVYQVTSRHKEARETYLLALKIEEAIKDTNRIASVMGNLGVISYSLGNYPEALDYYFNGLHIGEKYGDESLVSLMLSNIAIVYVELGEFNKALNYYNRALRISRKLNDKSGIANVLGNIGVVYNNLHDNKTALKYYAKAIKASEEIGDTHGIGNLLHNIGVAYREEKDHAKALENLFKSLEIEEKLGVKNIVANCHTDIGTVYTDMIVTLKTDIELFKKAENHLLLAITLNREIGAKKNEMDAERCLSELYEKTGKHDIALVHFIRFTALHDSIINSEQNNEITRKEMTYQFDKKTVLSKAQQEKKEALAKEAIMEQDQQKYFLIIGIVLLSVLALFIFRSYRQKQKNNLVILLQKTEVENKNLIIEEKQKEILDSIYYARRIQNALLPSNKYIHKTLVAQKTKS